MTPSTRGSCVTTRDYFTTRVAMARERADKARGILVPCEVHGPPVTDERSLDGAAFTPCVRGQSYGDLAEGAHTLRVRVDVAERILRADDERVRPSVSPVTTRVAGQGANGAPSSEHPKVAVRSGEVRT